MRTERIFGESCRKRVVANFAPRKKKKKKKRKKIYIYIDSYMYRLIVNSFLVFNF